MEGLKWVHEIFGYHHQYKKYGCGGVGFGTELTRPAPAHLRKCRVRLTQLVSCLLIPSFFFWKGKRKYTWMTEKEKTRCIYSHSLDMKLHCFSEVFLGFDLSSFLYFERFKKKTSIYGSVKIIERTIIGYHGLFNF